MSTSRRKPYTTEEPVTAHELLSTSPFEDDLDDELAARPERRRMSTLTMALAAAVLLVAGMVVGIQLQKLWGAASSRQAAIQGLLAGGGGGAGAGQRAGGGGRFGFPGAGQGQGRNGGQGQAGAGGAGGAFGNLTVGTVKLVDGGKIYLETTGGGIVTVRTSDGTKVQVSKEGKVKDLKPGSTIVVQGERGSDGSVTATSVNQGGAGGFAGPRGRG
ncbi:hypothetical protein ABZU32_14390 [Sphaerisporangium sp. NPDC005288]|uniref:hypothetical protein n=1 Tax=Sphaerisporangium sp. NPDC005288 TaxID=3155114 RepID=UPI0033B4E7C5